MKSKKQKEEEILATRTIYELDQWGEDNYLEKHLWMFDSEVSELIMIRRFQFYAKMSLTELGKYVIGIQFVKE